MADERDALLLRDNYYYVNCPGCKIDRQKAVNPNPPWLHFAFIWVVTLCAALPISFIFPFLYYMIRDFNIAEKEEDVSFYAGFEGSAYMIGRTLTSVLWGAVADSYGRKPVILFSIMAVIIFNTLFGLSVNYWMALTTRFLLGAFNGILGPIRAYAAEVARREHQALAMAMIASSWGVGLVIGPAIGGYLAQPAEIYPDAFSQDSVFRKFPYFLACLVLSVFSLAVFIICFWLPETLHTHDIAKDKPNDAEEADLRGSDDAEETQSTSSTLLVLLRNWPLMSAVIAYCVFQLHDMAYVEIFSLWGVSPKTNGGLGVSSEDIGQALAVAGVGLIVCQLFLYPDLERTFGPLLVSRVGAILSIALLSIYPFISNLSGWRLTLSLDAASALKNVLSVSIHTGLFLMQNRAVSQQQRGAANGLSLCAMSFCKAIGPAAAGSVLSWTQSRQNATFLPGSHMIFFLLNVIEFIGLLMTFKPFLATPAHEFC